MAWLSVREAYKLLGARDGDELYNWGRRGTNGVKRRESPDGWLYFVPDDVAGQTATVLDEEPDGALADLARMAARRPPSARRRDDDKTLEDTPNIKMAVVFSDWHVPVHHKRFTDNVLTFIGDVQPDTIVNNGDFVDLEAASSHGGNPTPPLLRDEMADGNAMLDRIGDVARKAKKFYLMGNHENRLNRAITKLMPTLYGAIEISDLLHLEERGWTVHDYMDPLMLGGFAVVHGTWCGKNYAAKYVRDFGASDGGGIGLGHTHRPQMMTQSNRSGFRAVYGFGHGADETKAVYLKKTPSDWVMGFGVVYYEDKPGGDWAAYHVLAPNGSFIWGGRKYD